MKPNTTIHLAAMSLGLAALFMAGCPSVPLEPPAAAALAGDWYSYLEDGQEVVVTFDQQGVVSRLVLITDDGTMVETNVSRATTTLENNKVTVMLGRSSRTYEGVLDESGNKIDGSLSQEFRIGIDVIVTIPRATLNLIRTSDCNQNEAYDHRDIGAQTSADCNENGVPDECDIADGTAVDADANMIPDECEGG